MHRCGTAILISLMGALGLLTGCLGKGSNNGSEQAVKTVNLSPGGNQSFDIGTIQNFSASAVNALGQTVPGAFIQFTVTSGNSDPAPLSINGNGSACAGTWDSTGTICSPGATGIAIVTATSQGVSSARTTVYVHQHIQRVQVTRIDNPIPPQHDCFSQGQSWQYQANAYDVNNLDITNSVGPFSWTAQNGNVLTVNSGISGLQVNQIQVTARTPGITQLYATVGGATSAPLATPFTTCLVSYIRLQAENITGNALTLNSGSQTIRATVVDSLGVTLASPPLTWSTSNPEAASFSSVTNTSGSNSVAARQNPGGANVTASCAPPSCNVGVGGYFDPNLGKVLPGLPIYASNGNLPVGGQPNGPPAFGVISVNVTPTKIPTYTAWAATTQCKNQQGCQSFTFSLAPGTNPIGVSATMSRTPNSMMFNQQGTRIYFGSDLGLMFMDVSGNPTVTQVSASSTPCSVALCGKVLNIAQDGNRVVVADSISNPHQVYIFNGASAAQAAPIALLLNTPTENAIAAGFSPDGLKVFILSDAGTMYVYSNVDPLTSFSVGKTATDVVFSGDSSIAYIAGAGGANSIAGYSTCSQPGVPSAIVGSGATFAAPTKLFPLPNVLANGPVLITTNNEKPGDMPNPNLNQPSLVQSILAVEPPELEILTTQYTQNPTTDPAQFTCNPPIAQDPVVPFIAPSSTHFDLGVGNFSPLYMRVTGNGTGAIVVASRIPAVLVVDLVQHTTTPIALANNGLPLAASASSDGSQVYVAACDVYTNNDPTTCTSGSVHIVAPFNGGDYQQVPYINYTSNNSMCTAATAPACFPDLIGIKVQ